MNKTGIVGGYVKVKGSILYVVVFDQLLTSAMVNRLMEFGLYTLTRVPFGLISTSIEFKHYT